MAETRMGAQELLLEETVTEQELETTERPGAQGKTDPSEEGETVVPGIVQEQEIANLQISPDFPAHQKKSGWLYIWVVVVVVCTRRLGTRTNMSETEVE